MKLMKLRLLMVVSILILFVHPMLAEAAEKPLVLQEMSWTDIRDYLTQNNMVIIPLGSTEQHGPHMPLGTDYYVATEASKAISARTGVIVAPVLLAGYSLYHSGFPGTLSLKPETMAQVLFESAQMLIKYGFRRFLFFSYHGGNRIPQETVISKINQETEAVAVAIGVGSPIQQSEDEGEFFDWHAGVEETSVMLYLKPELVKMDRAQKSIVHFTPQMEELRELAKNDKELLIIWNSLFGVPEETKKGGSSKDLTNNGIWSLSDPKTATAAKGEKLFLNMVERATKLVEAWKRAKK
jgi:creatinine amidohydrolase/Fe(II)-dependent formamide hydrolase-like protein